MPTLDWIGKSKVINHHQAVPYRVLERRYSYGDAESGNMIIHGDNLDALKALLPRFECKVNCIYIDPPYNTGNEAWVYNDNVNDPKIRKWLGEVVGKEGEDLTRHDKWLCMMYPRLRLLYKLLADDGVIFISIDNTELFNLKLICDEIFGNVNFVDIISWFKKASPSNDAQFFSNDIEYLVVYAKQKAQWKPRRLKLTEKQMEYYQNPDNDPKGAWNSATYTCNKSKAERPNLYYPIQNSNTGKLVYPKETAVWKYSESQTRQYQTEGRLYWGIDGKSKFPRIKKYLSDHKGVVNRTLWHYDDVNHTQGASTELSKIGVTGFATPKPSRLIERIIQIAADKDAIVLDSFAGSGTTAHAVLNMNKADGGNRRFILVEMEDYADNITAERVKRVIDGYGEGKNAVEGTGGGFGFYDLGEPLMIDGELNEAVDVEKIREYVWFMDTRQPYVSGSTENPYLLGVHNDTAWYFYYERSEITTLNYEFLSKIPKAAGHTVIYADRCAVSDAELDNMGVTFKKIPRDIAKL